MEKITRKTATLLGLKRFFTGVPCINGHISERYSTGGECVECMKLYRQKQRARDRNESANDRGIGPPDANAVQRLHVDQGSAALAGALKAA